MTEQDKRFITVLRQQNYTLKSIAEFLGLSHNTVKSYCRRKGIEVDPTERSKTLDDADFKRCPVCGELFPQNPKHTKQFCSSKCRTSWCRRKAKEKRFSANFGLDF